VNNIIFLAKDEVETFLPEGRMSEIRSLLEPCVVIDPEEILDQEAWIRLLGENNPEIILSAWRMRALPKEVLDEAPNLKYACYLTGSIRSVISRSLIENGLLVTNWGDSISRTISECALLLILGCVRKVGYWTQKMHVEGAWSDASTVTQSLFEKRIGIHGFGMIARKLVPLIRPFSDRISAFSPSVPQSLFDEFEVLRADSLEVLFSENDVVVELEAFTEETFRIVSEELLRSIPAGGVFVNVGRGAVVDEEALACVAKEGRIQIGLDVYDEEPLPKASPLRGLDNVLLLPHIGGPTTDRRVDAGDRALANLRAYRSGGELKGIIDLEVYDRST
jgi:phosphoglycerate dehydrogenase-like enzyme